MIFICDRSFERLGGRLIKKLFTSVYYKNKYIDYKVDLIKFSIIFIKTIYFVEN